MRDRLRRRLRAVRLADVPAAVPADDPRRVADRVRPAAAAADGGPAQRPRSSRARSSPAPGATGHGRSPARPSRRVGLVLLSGLDASTSGPDRRAVHARARRRARDGHAGARPRRAERGRPTRSSASPPRARPCSARSAARSAPPCWAPCSPNRLDTLKVIEDPSSAFTDALSLVFLVAAGAAAIAFVLSWALPEKPAAHDGRPICSRCSPCPPTPTRCARSRASWTSRIGREGARDFLRRVTTRAELDITPLGSFLLARAASDGRSTSTRSRRPTTSTAERLATPAVALHAQALLTTPTAPPGSRPTGAEAVDRLADARYGALCEMADEWQPEEHPELDRSAARALGRPGCANIGGCGQPQPPARRASPALDEAASSSRRSAAADHGPRGPDPPQHLARPRATTCSRCPRAIVRVHRGRHRRVDRGLVRDPDHRPAGRARHVRRVPLERAAGARRGPASGSGRSARPTGRAATACCGR